MLISEKKKIEVFTAKELYDKMVIENEEATTIDLMIEFARLKVKEALHETSKHFKNQENVYHVLNHFKTDKIC